ncbi:MAG TPA: hypothetical protein PLN61_07240 [bacterium]|nr:hypothetical protein [bacterium]HQI48445.1 hypothetical protein [bacterium]HQJ63899.1 hypothetical protein [bacterium]
MKKIVMLTLILGLVLLCTAAFSQPKPHGLFSEERKGFHNGNRIQTTFYNSGLIGRVSGIEEDIAGEWPKGSGHLYIGDQLTMVGAEIIDRDGQVKHSVVTPRGPKVDPRMGDRSSDGLTWYTWEALPGYAGKDTTVVAMSHIKKSWPVFWPDKEDAVDDPGWRNDAFDSDPKHAAWNGYFGKNQFNADQESYFVMDDYNDARYNFYPDSTDLSRRGLGLKISARGLQWAQVLAQDALFFIYDITNIGTTSYDKVVFSIICGYMAGGDGEDDNCTFERSINLTYTWDYDGIGSGGWSPVDIAGCAFLESPGNARDGIDNDGDGTSGSGKTINEEMFKPKALQAGQDVVKINYSDYARSVTKMPADSLVIIGPKNKRIVFRPGQQVEEIRFNGIDDNLNGLIDENNYNEIEITTGVTQKTYVYVGLKYIDYLTGEGLDNKLIDERRDDGIDNDGDWNPITDDVGMDGQFNTMDAGEGDGLPTSGAGTSLPGEPHIDKTDVSESDQLGLTSFYFFYPFNKFGLKEDEKLWNYTTPGSFVNGVGNNVDGDWIYASGYFPLKPGETERISTAILYSAWVPGDPRSGIVAKKGTAQFIYDENYNFAKAPNPPKVYASVGDGEVTIYWDDTAEYSYDAVSGYDFEGYRIYRASDPGFEDATPITNYLGSRLMSVPLAQYDRADGISGFYPEAYPGTGVEFYLGNDSGLAHSFRDTTVVNGYKYYYAVTSYDRGDLVNGFNPVECPIDVSIDAAGNVSLGSNVVAVIPAAKVAGYVKRDHTIPLQKVAGTMGTGSVVATIVDEKRIPENREILVKFTDTASDGVDNDGDWKKATDDLGADGIAGTGDPGEGDGVPTPGEPNLDNKDLQEWVPMTTGYGVYDITRAGVVDTLVQTTFIKLAEGSASPDTVVDSSGDIDGGRDFFYGMRLNIENATKIERILALSNWNVIRTTAPFNYSYVLTKFQFGGYYETGVEYPINYAVVATDDFNGRSAPLTIHKKNPNGTMGAAYNIPAVTTNFKVVNMDTKQEIPYAFLDYVQRPTFIQPGQLSNFDRIIFFEQVGSETKVTWSLYFTGNDTTAYHPKTGDTLRIVTTRPFGSHDSFRFTTKAATVDAKKAASELKNIKVVPNPYVASAGWEPLNPYATGRGSREIHFTHLPMKCTIRIYTVQGELIATVEHNSPFFDGTQAWNMLTRDNLDIAYGVYVYHVDAGDLGSFVGKFAVIK